MTAVGPSRASLFEEPVEAVGEDAKAAPRRAQLAEVHVGVVARGVAAPKESETLSDVCGRPCKSLADGPLQQCVGQNKALWLCGASLSGEAPVDPRESNRRHQETKVSLAGSPPVCLSVTISCTRAATAPCGWLRAMVSSSLPLPLRATPSHPRWDGKRGSDGPAQHEHFPSTVLPETTAG